MVRRRSDRDTLDLFRDFTPPEAEVSFKEKRPGYASLDQALFARALSAAIKDSEMDRDILCERMSAVLGTTVSLNTLNNWSAESKTDRDIPLRCAIAFAIVAGDARILSIGLKDSDFAVVERKHLPTIERAAAVKKLKALEDFIAQLDKEEGR